MRSRSFASNGHRIPRAGAGLAGVDRRTANRRRTAFTLLEVVLAISIAAGILMVVLLFYHQTETLRSRLLDETSRLATMRLVLERLDVELASARMSGPAGQGLSGGSDNLQFVKLGLPGNWDRTNAPASVSSGAALRLVSYSLVENTNSPADSGLLRSETPLSQAAATSTNLSLWATNDSTLDPLATNNTPRNGTLAAQIRFLRLRYWDGTLWADSWPGPSLPFGVEVTLGSDPLPPELAADEYPFEIYRRAIYLPNHAPPPVPTGFGGAVVSQLAR